MGIGAATLCTGAAISLFSNNPKPVIAQEQPAPINDIGIITEPGIGTPSEIKPAVVLNGFYVEVAKYA